MRMRKLGKGQSVVFCVPREIEDKISMQKGRDLTARKSIAVSDVLCWAIHETCIELRRTVPLWYNQGLRFYSQKPIWDQHADHSDKRKWAELFLEDEAQSLDNRYRPGHQLDFTPLPKGVCKSSISRLRDRCNDFGVTESHTASLREEQERELSPEAEQEQEVERPPPVEPREHRIHPDLLRFIRTGKFSKTSDCFKPAFKALINTSAATLFDVNEFLDYVWVTDDFSNTVQLTFGRSDCFQRSVQWILTPKDVSFLIIVSPYEAEAMLSSIETSANASMHLYSPRTCYELPALDHLSLYTIPQGNSQPIPKKMIIQLNLFAGQLYLSSFQDYSNVCDALGLAWGPTTGSVILGPDGFIPPGLDDDHAKNVSGLTKSPVKFFKIMTARIRQDCETIDKTHMGRILDGILLRSEDFEVKGRAS